MEKTAFIERTGGPEVIQWRDAELPPPGAGEVRMRHHAVGLNYIDTYHRSGLYPIDLPGGLGSEAAGVVEAVGEGVTDFKVGDRVGVFGPARGAYATARNVSADLLVPLPEEVDDRTAAAILLKGTTTAFLIEDCAKVQPGWTVLVHAAAGGVGHLAVGWLKAIGATVIGTVGSEAKAERARAAGADHVILNRSEDVAARVRDITGGTGVPVVLDGVGKATWEASLNSAARRGLVVSFGNASGPVDGVNLGILAAKGSLFVTRPTLFDYALTAADKRRLAERVFAMLAKGAIIPEIGQEFPLTDAAEAHRAIEAGETVGSTVLIP
ncbi:alcohol dehydrogenase GroES-like domain protein [Sphingomonas sp. S17]|mgnify:CR=1 FL=1|uniref:Quinone oxidoreductase n=3 Tax=Pseudomonadota TaxID=1224 RepID=A0A411LEN0_SPHPI|nr:MULTISPECIES: quinone oxidoreductase [Sphingomonas]EGI54560.1 alcohol dehydrogenase GroES-like domain protein [Sphingomonas sp. S17]MBQ1480411.1 quinone oxidoreductase [Sphingomonas sp.]MCM3680858.1 quinone oxidoreductase [Sphingomonas paucimobilis]MDG5971433.1 quinone oxidoreductase [Sphingomonas paucimobilis]NNG58693.1 quinone oxidoreductase [Sphingomonas paucimobilis]